jgi:hypothetical protein
MLKKDAPDAEEIAMPFKPCIVKKRHYDPYISDVLAPIQVNKYIT